MNIKQTLGVTLTVATLLLCGAITQAADDAARDVKLTGALRQALNKAQEAMDRKLADNARANQREKLEQWRLWDIEVSEAEAADSPLEAPDPVFLDRTRNKALPADWKRLTLTAEIAADLPSPSEDQGERMALQVEFMNAGKRRFSAADRDRLLEQLKNYLAPSCGVLISIPNCHFGAHDIERRPLRRDDPRHDRSLVWKDLRFLARWCYRSGFQHVETFGSYDAFLLALRESGS